MFVEGEKNNRLKVIKFSHYDKRHRKHYLCLYDCGKYKTIQGSMLRSGNTKSCGCLSTEVRKNRRISKNHSEITAIILGYKRHAKDRKLKWCLERDFIELVILKSCHYCGEHPSNIKRTKNSIDFGMKYNGIDRIDSCKDYIKSNVVPCCKQCNLAKRNISVDEFRSWAIRLGQKAMADQWRSL